MYMYMYVGEQTWTQVIYVGVQNILFAFEWGYYCTDSNLLRMGSMITAIPNWTLLHVQRLSV